MRTFHSATPIIPDDGAYLRERAVQIIQKYAREPERARTLNEIQMSGDATLLQGINMAYEQIERNREAIRFLEDAIAFARNVMAFRARETVANGTRNAERVMAEFLGVFIEKLNEGGALGMEQPAWLR